MNEPQEEKRESARSAAAAAREATLPGVKRWTRLLTKAEKDPFSVLRDKRCLRPHFVEMFFDLCESKVITDPLAAEDYVAAATKLAEKTMVRHHWVRVADFLVLACINVQAWEKAAEYLEMSRELAYGCCKPCTSLWLRRQGDLLLETRDPEASRQALDESIAILGEDLDDQTRGHALFLRGIASYGLKDVDRALGDMGQALRLWSLSTRKAYFMEAIALIACFLEYTDDEAHYEAALEHLQQFRERLYKLRYWTKVRDRLRWVTGQIEAWLGNREIGRAMIARARKNMLESSPARHTLAIALDEALLYCYERSELYRHPIGRVLTWCANHLRLEKSLRDALSAAIADFEERPYDAQSILCKLRRSYVVPVPCLVGHL